MWGFIATTHDAAFLRRGRRSWFLVGGALFDDSTVRQLHRVAPANALPALRLLVRVMHQRTVTVADLHDVERAPAQGGPELLLVVHLAAARLDRADDLLERPRVRAVLRQVDLRSLQSFHSEELVEPHARAGRLRGGRHDPARSEAN